uniref:Uncharacterized protein n=1 Tax=Cacopsylla melanoneura TaxID=428564 RepID=A0A8D8QMY9_9HEMI
MMPFKCSRRTGPYSWPQLQCRAENHYFQSRITKHYSLVFYLSSSFKFPSLHHISLTLHISPTLSNFHHSLLSPSLLHISLTHSNFPKLFTFPSLLQIYLSYSHFPHYFTFPSLLHNIQILFPFFLNIFLT